MNARAPLAVIRPPPQVLARVYREPGNSCIKLTLYQLFTADSLSASLVSGTVGGTWRFQGLLIEQKPVFFSVPAGLPT